MNDNNTQQNNEEGLQNVLSYLARAPHSEEVERGFAQLLTTVTNKKEERIPFMSSQKTSIISLLSMTNLQKIIGASAVALILVLAIGYVTVFKHGPSSNYDDVANAVVDDPSTYQVADNQDSFSDLDEQDPAGSSSILDDSAQTSQTAAANDTSTSVDVTLSDLDTLFASDDIDDTDLQTFSTTDTGATDDSLTEDFNI